MDCPFSCLYLSISSSLLFGLSELHTLQDPARTSSSLQSFPDAPERGSCSHPRLRLRCTPSKKGSARRLLGGQHDSDIVSPVCEKDLLPLAWPRQVSTSHLCETWSKNMILLHEVLGVQAPSCPPACGSTLPSMLPVFAWARTADQQKGTKGKRRACPFPLKYTLASAHIPLTRIN